MFIKTFAVSRKGIIFLLELSSVLVLFSNCICFCSMFYYLRTDIFCFLKAFSMWLLNHLGWVLAIIFFVGIHLSFRSSNPLKNKSYTIFKCSSLVMFSSTFSSRAVKNCYSFINICLLILENDYIIILFDLYSTTTTTAGDDGRRSRAVVCGKERPDRRKDARVKLLLEIIILSSETHSSLADNFFL